MLGDIIVDNGSLLAATADELVCVVARPVVPGIVIGVTSAGCSVVTDSTTRGTVVVAGAAGPVVPGVFTGSTIVCVSAITGSTTCGTVVVNRVDTGSNVTDCDRSTKGE